jgi:ATP-dependent protease HslVU (ClpYQ) peptidase subunit
VHGRAAEQASLFEDDARALRERRLEAAEAANALLEDERADSFERKLRALT